MISIFVSKALAVVTDNETLTSGMAGAEIKFSFSEDWDNLTKTAIFRAGDVANAVIGSQWTDNVCTIPHETLATAGEELRVGVYGVNSDKKVIIPTIWATVGVVRVGVDPSADESTDATLPVWAQVQETAEGAEKTAEEAKETADHAENIAKVFLITYNGSAVDKTYAEIVEAVNAGNTIHISFLDGSVYEPQVKITENGPVKLEWMRIMSEEHYWAAVTIATDGTATDISAHIADGADLAKYRTTDDSYSKAEVDEKVAGIDLSEYAKTADVPIKTSQLTNDSGFLTEQGLATDAELVYGERIEVLDSLWNARSLDSTPTKNSKTAVTSGGVYDALADYRKISDSYSKSETDTLLASAGKVKTVNGVEPDANGNIEIEGGTGKDGTTFTPNVSADGTLSWTNDGGKDNPASVNIKGAKGDTGAQGADGTNGKDGTSVTVASVSESTADGGSNVVTFSDGKAVTIKNGSKGSTGNDGKTPVKGTDYWTDADKSEIVTEVVAALPKYGGTVE